MVRVMSEVKPVHRYKAQTLFSFGGAKIEYFPHGPDVVLATEFDAQRLRADTAEAELRTERLRADAAVGDANEAERKLAAAEQRIASHESILRRFANCADVRQVGTLAMDYVAALNQKSEGESQSDYLQSCAAAERALAIKPPCQQPQAHPARCGCED